MSPERMRTKTNDKIRTRIKIRVKSRRKTTVMTGITQDLNVGLYEDLALPPFHQVCPSQLFIQAVKLSMLTPGKAIFVTENDRKRRK